MIWLIPNWVKILLTFMIFKLRIFVDFNERAIIYFYNFLLLCIISQNRTLAFIKTIRTILNGIAFKVFRNALILRRFLASKWSPSRAIRTNHWICWTEDKTNYRNDMILDSHTLIRSNDNLEIWRTINLCIKYNINAWVREYKTSRILCFAPFSHWGRTKLNKISAFFARSIINRNILNRNYHSVNFFRHKYSYTACFIRNSVTDSCRFYY
jgi:hypothetical protein